MSFAVIATNQFKRSARRFRRAHPELIDRLNDVLRALAADPFQPHLRLHPLRGDLSGLHAVSVTHRYRVILILQITEREITLLDIGSHDEVYR
jgi:addiction module RelE/StbE family toxin